jgi:hypothetical protein
VVRVSGYKSRGPGFDSQPYQILWEVGGLERGPLSLMRTIEELLEWKSSGSGLKKNEINGRGNSLRWPRNTLYPQRLALTSPTSGGHWVGIVRLRTRPRSFLVFSLDPPVRRALPSSTVYTSTQDRNTALTSGLYPCVSCRGRVDRHVPLIMSGRNLEAFVGYMYVKSVSFCVWSLFAWM